MSDRFNGTRSMSNRIVDDPDFQMLVRERTRFGWTMSAAMLVVYLAFILLVAFGKGLMATRLGDTNISVGIVLGIGVILFAFALTGVYVGRANSRFDELAARVLKDAR